MSSTKSIFQMYRELSSQGAVLLWAVKRKGVLTGDWQARYYPCSEDLDANKPSVIIEASTADFAVERLYGRVIGGEK